MPFVYITYSILNYFSTTPWEYKETNVLVALHKTTAANPVLCITKALSLCLCT